jgi:hypothetical protein
LPDHVESATIGEGVLSVDFDSDKLDFAGLILTIGTDVLTNSSADGKYSLNGVTLNGSSTVVMTGTLTATEDVTVSSITISMNIERFEEIVVQTKADGSQSGSESTEIDLTAIPQGVNFITFDAIGLNLEFQFLINGEEGSGDFELHDLPIVIDAPLLGLLAADGTGRKVTDENSFREGLSFVKEDYTLYFVEEDFDNPAFQAEYPGILVDRDGSLTDNEVTVYVNPEINGRYAQITLKNVRPGNFEVSVIPEVKLELNSANINLDKFVKDLYSDPDEMPLTGKFPEGEGLDLSSIFEDMGAIGENVNFDQLDLYLYMVGDPEDRELLGGTKFEFTAQWSPDPSLAGDGSHALTALGGQAFTSLEKSRPDFSDSPFTDALVEGDAHFFTSELVDIINRRPSDLRMEYNITLADHLQISRAHLERGAVSLQPEMALVLPLRIRALDDDNSGYGSLKFADILPEEDIFHREGPDNEINEYLKQLGRIRLRVDYDNTLGLDQVFVYLVSRDDNGEPNWEKSITLHEGLNQTLSLDIGADDFLIWPFRPDVEIRVPVEPGENYGVIEIKRGPEGVAGIRARLSVEIESYVDMEIDL